MKPRLRISEHEKKVAAMARVNRKKLFWAEWKKRVKDGRIAGK